MSKTALWKRRENAKITDRLALTGIGVSATLGIGVFLVIGYVARSIAGPAVVVSVVIAAATALLSGLFYAELSVRLSKKPSTYNFSYVCIGDFVGFIIGWTLLLEYTIGVAAVAKGISLHLDTLLNDVVRLYLTEAVPIGWSIMSNYFDVLAFVIPLIMAVAILLGYRKVALVEKLIMIVSIAAVLFIIIAGAVNAQPANWSLPNLDYDLVENTPARAGGFIPFGTIGIFRGAAICTFIFIGFDVLLMANRTVSKIITYVGAISYGIVFVGLVGCSIVLTLMSPFYQLSDYVPVPQAFADVQFIVAQWIVSIAGITVLFSSLWGLMFAIEQIISAMAEDGLLFKGSTQTDTITTSTTNTTTITTAAATDVTTSTMEKSIYGLLCAAVLASLFAGLFTIGHLIDLLSIGTLLAFIVMAISIVMLRFSNQLELGSISTVDIGELRQEQRKTVDNASWGQVMQQLFRYHSSNSKPTKLSFRIVKMLLLLLTLTCAALALLVRIAILDIYYMEIWAVSVLAALILLTLLLILMISLQPKRTCETGFTVPMVPLLAGISIFVNVYLITVLDYYALTRFVIWIVLGLPVFIMSTCCNDQPKTNTNGISKIQGYHNAGYAKDAEPHTSTLTLTSATNDSSEFIETENPNVLATSNELHHSTESVLEPDMYQQKVQSLEVVPLAAVAMVSTHPECGEVPKTRTPSPNSSLDDIVLASEIIDTLSERKEPNGKIYFVNEMRPESVTPAVTDTLVQSTAEEKEEKSVIDLLDDVIKMEDVEVETSTVAVVHRKVDDDYDDNNDKNGDNEVGNILSFDGQADSVSLNHTVVTANGISDGMEMALATDSPDLFDLENKSPNSQEIVVFSKISSEELNEIPICLPIIMVENAYDTQKKNNDTPNNSDTQSIPYIPPADYDMPVMIPPLREPQNISVRIKTTPNLNSSDDDGGVSSQQFKERLTMLLGQNRFMENPKRPQDRSKSPIKSTKSIDTNVESDINQQVMAQIRATRSKAALRQRSEMPRKLLSVAPSEPFIDPTSIATSKASVMKPPPAPLFDPVLYNTLGRSKSMIAVSHRNGTESAASSSPPIIEPSVQFRRAIFDSHNDDENRESRMSSIRGKLENILRRGPPMPYVRPKTMAEMPVVTALPAAPQPEQQNGAVQSQYSAEQQVVNFKESKKPFDTVHKQKLLFNDVLKSIAPEVRPGLVRSASSAARHSRPSTIQNARDELQPIS